ncbi:hypothetical protein C0995_001052 [Termitomyces sp. Mi166|nr:hypothetical protein C0995_001052 [Termitomyces sp. Mi166\
MDCLSRYFESDTIDDVHNIYDYVQVDKWIDPEDEDLPLHRFYEITEKKVEIRAMQAQELRHTQVLEKRTESLTTDDNPAVAQVLTTGTKSSMNREHGEAQMHAHILQGYKKD